MDKVLLNLVDHYDPKEGNPIHKSEIHYSGRIGDATLCGVSYDEDKDWPEKFQGESTSKSVDCQQCIAIQKHVMGDKSDPQ